MDSKLTKKDHQILQYVCEHFSCKICNNILMQSVTLSCGHNYCSYCLDLLHAGMQNECPECASPIRCAKANNSIDQKIDNMLSSCSEFIQKAYASALDARFQKAFDRNLARRNNARMTSADYNANEEAKPKLSNCLDEIRNTLQMNDINPQHSVSKSLKSARKFQSHRKADILPERPSSSRPRSKPAPPPVIAPKPYENDQASSEIDINKANLLFGIYDHVLGLDNNEPNKDMAAGDFLRDNDVPPMNVPILEGLSNYTKRSEVELEQLIKETDDIIRLDGHIQEWTNKMKNALNGTDEKTGLAENKADKNVHIVDDELWKASNELLQKLQGIQKRKIVAPPHLSLTCPSTPVPRSAKVNFEALSDDSDEESYDNALMDILHGCLENPYDFSSIQSQSSSQDSEEDKVEIQNNHGAPKVANAKKTEKQSEQQSDGTMNKNAANSSGNRSARKKSILDSMEESGHNYIKENIEFITQMRKYKEALMKIQNREVVTAQEIKELVPTTSFPSDGQDFTTLTKCEAPTTPRRLSGSGPRRNHSYSARLPMSARLDHKPMTATYDAPSTQSIRKQITSAPTTPSSSKHYLKRTRASNSIFTAR